MICSLCGLENNMGTVECESCGTDLYSNNTKNSSPFDEHLVADIIDLLEPKEPLVIKSTTPILKTVELMHLHDTGCALISKEKKNSRNIYGKRPYT